MKCLKCSCENFILESTIIITENYKIYKNGRVSDHPISTDFCNGDMADNDNVIRCTNCKIGYVLPECGRNDLLNKIDFSKVDLKDAIMIEF